MINVSIVLRPNKMEVPERIVQQAEMLFKTRGIRNVTMDDIAKALGMSKKTLYQFVQNKADIVHLVSKTHFDSEIRRLIDIQSQATDPIEEMVMILKSVAQTFKEIPATMIYEVQKYYPAAWDQFHDFKSNHMVDALRNNLLAGRNAGFYRHNFDLEICIKLRIEQIFMVMDPVRFPPTEFDLGKIQIEMFSLFLHGLVTPKGAELLNQYLNQVVYEA